MVSVEIERRDEVSIIWMDNPPVNALGAALRAAILHAVEAAVQDEAVIGMVLASRHAIFSAGADIKEFNQTPVSPSLRELIDAMDASPKPIVAAINGVCFGGGLELALACDARIVTSTARLALPEVKLGLLPGAGGTQRLPRLMNPADALKLMATGAPATGDQAVTSGLADALAAAERLLAEATAKASLLAKRTVRQRLRDTAADQGTRDAFEKAAATLLKAHPGEPQIEALIEAVRGSYEVPFDEGMRQERRSFERLLVDDRSKSLRHAFFAERESGQLPGDIGSPDVIDVKTVGVIGGGTMGSGIAMAFAANGFPVTLIETDEPSAQRAYDRIASSLSNSVRRGSLSETARSENLARIKTAVDYAELSAADLVIEAAFEEMDVKRQIFGRLADVVKPSAILATNTSYLDVDAIAEAGGDAGRVIGMHFFSPANIMKLVEVVRGRKTSASTIATVVKVAQKLGKLPVVVGNCHGFVGNRILARRSEQLDRLLLEGATPEDVDRAFTAFGSKLGPCTMGDLAGLDISWRMRRATGRTAPVADALVEAGRLGQKTGRGYYRYAEDGRTPISDLEVTTLIEAVSKKQGVKRRTIDQEEIIDRLILPMINEGARIIEEGVAARPGDIDVIWIHGYGFPRWRGGPMFYAQTRGYPNVVARLKELATLTGDESLRPEPLLEHLATDGKSVAPQ
ncbi:3-hydroxyacyl-CoA dehydrogenase NAD-binding domain-containing protein [Microvirga pudoricolor]|uniref:3-hydroxyacyl-CoA dehydrogenase NAD-binding domain-containing protein n=1 Tax=Microvirga pudoricolor TaxID=2778729 RepID=UPI00194F0EB1|nr:3-hydroxyacyl-CoA dehydrogenase NAD-binding domain-containing protein [Microvirga pudoricolor]MBM6593127.1 enoyl-CoA hydratase/isomerase family protein [Microvirga pudoricolor]